MQNHRHQGRGLHRQGHRARACGGIQRKQAGQGHGLHNPVFKQQGRWHRDGHNHRHRQIRRIRQQDFQNQSHAREAVRRDARHETADGDVEEGQRHYRLRSAVQPEKDLRVGEESDHPESRHGEDRIEAAATEKDLLCAHPHLQDGEGQEVLLYMVKRKSDYDEGIVTR